MNNSTPALTLVETPTENTCQPWCGIHDAEAGVCIGKAVTLDFTAPGRHNYLATAAHIQLSHCITEGTDMTVTIGHGGITLDDADRLADAMKAVVAYARLGGSR